MRNIEDISDFLRNELSERAYNFDDLDEELGLRAGSILRILDATGDYSVTELLVVLDRFGLEIDIFDKEALKRMKEGPNGPAPELAVKTKVQVAVERIRAQHASHEED